MTRAEYCQDGQRNTALSISGLPDARAVVICHGVICTDDFDGKNDGGVKGASALTRYPTLHNAHLLISVDIEMETASHHPSTYG